MDLLKELELKKSELIVYFKNQLAGIRSGRPTAKLVENIQVDYSGQKLPVKQLGSISVLPPREIQIMVWDKSVAPEIKKSVESLLNVQADVSNNLIRVSLPPLSEERRRELIKVTRKEAEEARIKLRAARDEFLKKIKQQEEKGEITEDDKFALKDKIQKIIDGANEEFEKVLEGKVREIEE